MQLEFTADWGGIATGLVSAGLQYNAQRNNLKLEMAKLQAQQKLNQLAMQPPAAYPPGYQQPMYPQPVYGQPAVGIAPNPALRPPTYAPQQISRFPSWALPAAGAGVGVVLLMALLKGMK